MREFGRLEYKNTVYINFDENRDIHTLFARNLDTGRIIESLRIEYHTEIEPGDTLIIFDEVQECNRALISLKYFCENALQYHIIAAGSFLGVAMHEGNSFPVGKVDMMTLYPLTFFEFLDAAGEERFTRPLFELDYSLIDGMRGKYIEFLKYYFYVGGMPEAVLAFSRDRNIENVRRIQGDIVRSYQGDFSKHIASADIPKAGLIWNSVPAQLGRENRKFLYADIKHGARAREYENALHWLINSGLIYQVHRVSLPHLPLISYAEYEHFKIYMLDIGLLAAMTSLDIKTLIDPGTALFDHFKGALAEQYVLQELKALDKSLPIFYWANSKGLSEVDFIIQKWNEIIPLEVKSGINLKAKSLKVFIDLFNPKIALRSSLAGFSRNGNLFEIPLYLIGMFGEILKSRYD
jgi:predicted AAA+ superfamily ATPase